MYFTYILFSKVLNKYYTGSTNNLERRIQEHNNSKEEFTKKGVPWELIYSKAIDSRAFAVQLELKIKKRGAKRYLQEMESNG